MLGADLQAFSNLPLSLPRLYNPMQAFICQFPRRLKHAVGWLVVIIINQHKKEFYQRRRKNEN